jgi:glycosyltransferase involved in cell wall biosynthesis
LPCLASAIGGNTDLLGNGEVGFLLAADDSGAWAEAIVRVLTDRDLAQRLGSAARRRIEAEYSIEAVVGRYQELYRRMLSGDAISAMKNRQKARQ